MHTLQFYFISNNRKTFISTGNRFNSIHGYLLITCAWLYALLFASSPLVYWGKYGPEPYGTACCIDWRMSNQHTMARTYTLALFILCYILPSSVIVASYAGILLTVQASRKNMEQHTSRQTHMGGIQTIIVKVRRIINPLCQTYCFFKSLFFLSCNPLRIYTLHIRLIRV